MSQKLGCDRCSALVDGTITYAERLVSIHVTGAVGDGGWSHITAPYYKGKSTAPPTKLLCERCVGALHDFLLPLPLAAQ